MSEYSSSLSDGEQSYPFSDGEQSYPFTDDYDKIVNSNSSESFNNPGYHPSENYDTYDSSDYESDEYSIPDYKEFNEMMAFIDELTLKDVKMLKENIPMSYYHVFKMLDCFEKYLANENNNKNSILTLDGISRETDIKIMSFAPLLNVMADCFDSFDSFDNFNEESEPMKMNLSLVMPSAPFKKPENDQELFDFILGLNIHCLKWMKQQESDNSGGVTAITSKIIDVFISCKLDNKNVSLGDMLQEFKHYFFGYGSNIFHHFVTYYVHGMDPNPRWCDDEVAKKPSMKKKTKSFKIFELF
jgi:hypothetical protein